MPDYKSAMKAGDQYAEMLLKALGIDIAGVTHFQINFEADGFAKISIERILTTEEIAAIAKAQSETFRKLEEQTGAKKEREEMMEVIDALNASWEKSPNH